MTRYTVRFAPASGYLTDWQVYDTETQDVVALATDSEDAHELAALFNEIRPDDAAEIVH